MIGYFSESLAKQRGYAVYRPTCRGDAREVMVIGVFASREQHAECCRAADCVEVGEVSG